MTEPTHKKKDELISVTTKDGFSYIAKVCPVCKRIGMLSRDFGKKHGRYMCDRCYKEKRVKLRMSI